MRKRLVIGAIAAVVIGIAAYVLSQPRKGNVEYHKRKYVKAETVGTLGVWLHKRPVPAFVRDAYLQWKYDSREFHRQALIEAGYLTERTFFVSNRITSVTTVAMARLGRTMSDTNYRFTTLWDAATNRVGVLAPAHCMGTIAQAIRDADK